MDAVRCTLHHHGDHTGFDHGLEELIDPAFDILSGISTFDHVHGRFHNRTVKGYSEAVSPVHFLKSFVQMISKIIHLEQHIRSGKYCIEKRRYARGFLDGIVGLFTGENPVAKTLPYLPEVIKGVYKGDLNPLAKEPESAYTSRKENRNWMDTVADLTNTAAILMEKGGVSPAHVARHIPSLIQSIGHGELF